MAWWWHQKCFDWGRPVKCEKSTHTAPQQVGFGSGRASAWGLSVLGTVGGATARDQKLTIWRESRLGMQGMRTDRQICIYQNRLSFANWEFCCRSSERFLWSKFCAIDMGFSVHPRECSKATAVFVPSFEDDFSAQVWKSGSSRLYASIFSSCSQQKIKWMQFQRFRSYFVPAPTRYVFMFI